MFAADQYALLDFGDGRKLERFGELILDRPCPAAERVSRADPARWSSADARFERRTELTGVWSAARALPDRWTIDYGRLRFELKRTEFGHVGLFPEQMANWDWLARRSLASLRVLNLFAYTGGSTLAAAAAGAEVAHVDAARNVVAWARANAGLSGLAEAPVRWIADDAVKFCKRECRRGAAYQAVILDPPSYGHGARGEVWRLSTHLRPLLQLCAQLTADDRRFVLLTCHTPGFEEDRLGRLLAETFGDGPAGKVRGETMRLCSATGRTLPSGVCAVWER